MRFNRPQAKIHFKSDSNRVLIDFFDLISTVRFNRRDDTIRIRTQISNPISNYIENWSNLVENGQKRPDFNIFDINRCFRYNLSFSIK